MGGPVATDDTNSAIHFEPDLLALLDQEALVAEAAP